METVTVRMARGDRQTSWGFGVTEAPNGEVFIVNVVGGSLADRAGLRNGDLIDSLEGLGNLDINAVDRLLVTSRDKIEIVVHRSSGGGGQARIWRPEITDNRAQNGSMFTGAPPPVEDRPYRVSLEHNSDTRPPQGFNQAPMPFNADPRVKHLQYNSPMGLYSNDNVAESYQQQTQGFVEGAAGVQGGRTSHDQPAYLRSETLRLLKEQEGRGGSTLSSHPNPNGLPTCFVCTRPILGVMARAAGKDIHGDCLSCATCGNSLRNVGHHFIDDKFYCDIHGRQKKCMTPVGLDPNAAVRSAPTAAQPVRPTENIRAFYQPEVLQRKASPSPAPGQTIVSTHYGNPKTQGPISPSNRGVPTGTTYADGAASARQSVGRALSPAMRQMAPPAQPAPPVPANPPPSAANTFTRSTFERSERKDDYSNRGGAGSGSTGGANTLNQAMSNLSVGGAGSNVRAGAGAGGARVAEGRGQGSLTNPGGRIPFCEACKQQIRGAFVLATGLAWCPEHFVCANSRCGRRLLECGFVEENGQKYCEGCFEAHIAPRCEKCAKPIVSDCLNALQKKWHPTCFTCSHCQKPFGNSAFYLENQLPYCEADWNKLFTTKCVSCQYAIEAGDRWVEALGSAFHSNCFNCTRCRTNLEGESFFAKNGQPFCKLHA